jgi:hypothetical protein
MPREFKYSKDKARGARPLQERKYLFSGYTMRSEKSRRLPSIQAMNDSSLCIKINHETITSNT